MGQYSDLAAEVMAEVAAEGKATPPADEKAISTEELAKLDAPRKASEEPSKDEEELEGEGEASEEEKPASDAEKAAKEPAKADGEEKKPKPKRKLVPQEVLDKRVGEEYAKRRQTERELQAAKDEIQRLKNEGKTPTDEERIRADERLKVLTEAKFETWDKTGCEVYGEQEFRDACGNIANLGFGRDLVALAQTATDTDRQATKAIWYFSQESPEFIDKFLKMPRERQAAELAKLAARRERSNGAEPEPEPEPEAPAAKPPIRVSNAPQPIRPITPTHAETDNIYDEKVSQDEFYRRVAKNPKLAAIMGVDGAR